MVFSKRYKFSEWKNSNLPAVSAGVYAIWQGDRLLYCDVEYWEHK